jgi:hypothetical protein
VVCSADGYLKDDLVQILENHLNSNEGIFAKLPEFRDYYGRNGSPIKRRRTLNKEVSYVEPEYASRHASRLTCAQPRVYSHHHVYPRHYA